MQSIKYGLNWNVNYHYIALKTSITDINMKNNECRTILKHPYYPQSENDKIDANSIYYNNEDFLIMVLENYGNPEMDDTIEGYLVLDDNKIHSNKRTLLAHQEHTNCFQVLFDITLFKVSGTYQGYYTVTRRSGNKSCSKSLALTIVGLKNKPNINV